MAKVHSSGDCNLNHFSMREGGFQPGDIIADATYDAMYQIDPQYQYVVLGMTPTWSRLGMYYLVCKKSSFDQGDMSSLVEMPGLRMTAVGKI